MDNNKKSLISSQIVIVLYLLAAAVSAVETLGQFRKGGFSNPWIYFTGALFIVCAIMYFIKKKQRYERHQK